MATAKDYNRTTLDEFPGYDCYYIVDCDGAWGLGKSFTKTDPIRFRYYTRYGWFQSMNNCHSIIKKSEIPNVICGTSDIKDTDTFIVHPDCIVPRTLVTVGKVLNDKSPEVPTKFIIPYNYYDTINGYSCVLMVNHNAKIVFMVITECDDGNIRGTWQEWQNALHISSDLVQTFTPEELSGFTMPYGTSVFLVANLHDCDIALAQGRIPADKVVCETKLTTGTKLLDVNILYSCYKMLNSTDNQIVESACNMLARNRFDSVDAIVGWLLRTYRSKIRYYRSKSTAFRWCWSRCYNKYKMTTPKMKQDAKELVIRITNNEIHWNDGTMVVSKAQWFEDPPIRNFVDCINKS